MKKKTVIIFVKLMIDRQKAFFFFLRCWHLSLADGSLGRQRLKFLFVIIENFNLIYINTLQIQQNYCLNLPLSVIILSPVGSFVLSNGFKNEIGSTIANI